MQKEKIKEIQNEYNKLLITHNTRLKKMSPEVPRLQEELRKLRADHQRAIRQLEPQISKLVLELEKSEIDHRNAIEFQKQKVDELKTSLANFRDTRLVNAPMISLQPTGQSKKLIVSLTLILGLMLGLLTVFFAEFLMKVNQHQTPEAQGRDAAEEQMEEKNLPLRNAS